MSCARYDATYLSREETSMKYHDIAAGISSQLQLASPPVAMSFVEVAPPGMAVFDQEVLPRKSADPKERGSALPYFGYGSKRAFSSQPLY